MITITRRGFNLQEASDIVRLKNEFAGQNCAVIPHLFEKYLVESILSRIEKARFYPQKHGGGENLKEFASDLTMRENEAALHQVHLLLNNPRLFRVIETITGCLPIGGFSGRIYQNLPDSNHQLEWHDDTEQKSRLVGISVNFSPAPIRGGVFQIREKKSKMITGEVGGRDLGDAHIFRISPDFQHRVTATRGKFARISAAGWFVSEPDFMNFIRRERAAAE